MSNRGLVFLFALLAADALCIAVAILWGEPPSQYFKEHGFVTHLSFLQLLLTSAIAVATAFHRWRGEKMGWRAPYLFWALVAAGFLYLAVDEVARIHEKLDRQVIHKRILKIPETPLTDRIDDAIIGAYAVMAALVVYRYREEIGREKGVRQAVWWGAAIFGVMWGVEILTDDQAIYHLLGLDETLIGFLDRWSQVVEDSLKVIAEAFFATSAFCGLLAARSDWGDVSSAP